MSTVSKEEKEQQLFELEQKKVKALEKIANSLDALTLFFEEIDKDEWSDRIQFYLAEFHSRAYMGVPNGTLSYKDNKEQKEQKEENEG